MSDDIDRVANYLRSHGLEKTDGIAYARHAELICQPMLDEIERLRAYIKVGNITITDRDGAYQVPIYINKTDVRRPKD